jgi:PTH1 family peptidyl-tRNA hydrolase
LSRLLIVGLGNPGPAYAGNRHNIGFMAVDAIAARHRFAPFRAKFQSQLAEGSLAGRPVLLLKPMTFMNVSGQAVLAASTFFKIPPADVLVFHDEIDLAAGKVRVKTGGGHAGHNGLRSLHAHIGPDYHRLRIGVGRPGSKHEVADHVLDDFAKADRAWLDPLLDAIAENAPLLAAGEGEAFMSKVALATRPAKEKRPRERKEAADGGNGL